MNRPPAHRNRPAGVLVLALLAALVVTAVACNPPGESRDRFRLAGSIGATSDFDSARLAGLKLPASQMETLTFAETYEFWTAPTLLAASLGFYEQEGLEVRVAKFPTGLAAKNAVLSRSADLGLVADTPVALGGFQGEPVSLIATYFQSDRIVKLVASNGNGKTVAETLGTETVGYVPGTISELVLERILEKYGLPREKVRTVALRPTGMVYALARGDIGAFVGWEPMPIYARRELGEAHVRVLEEQLYSVSLHLVTRPEVIESKPSALLKFLLALKRAQEAIAEDPQGTRRRVEEELGFTPGELEPFWDASQFKVKLDREALTDRLADEAEWLRRAGYARGQVPSYDAYIDERIYRAFVALEHGLSG